MIRWKNYFYFNKGDKIGVLLLLILIFISGGVFIYLGNYSKLDVGYYQFASEAQNEFVEFEEKLELKEEIKENELTGGEEQTAAQILPKNKGKESSKLSFGQVIDINSVSSNTFKRIPGIGTTFADQIVQYRSELGGICDLTQLKEIKGITNNKFIQILPYVTIKKQHSVMNINRVAADRLSKHPYISEKQLNEILTLRQNSRLESTDDLLINRVFLPKDIDRLAPYISFE